MTISVCLYFPKEPENLFKFLDTALRFEFLEQKRSEGTTLKSEDLNQYHSIVLNPNYSKTLELLLWVDNNDHKVSYEFYTLRRFIRKGLNVQVFVGPNLESTDKVFEFLSTKSTGDGVIVNNGYYTDIELLVNRPETTATEVALTR